MVNLGGLSYQPFEKIKIKKPVNRIEYLKEKVRGKVVLDIGAYDETAIFKKGTKYWLHEELSKEALIVIGIDNSNNIPDLGIITSKNSHILKGDINELDYNSLNCDIDIIIAGEFIEHLPNCLDFCITLKSNPNISNKLLIFTTPNSTSFHNIILGVICRESTHQDHLQTYSYKTLNTICYRAGFKSWTIMPYHVSFSETILNSNGPKKTVFFIFEKIVNLIEKLFPLFSGGYIVEIVV